MLDFLPIDYAWMVGSGIVIQSGATWKAFSEGYRATHARITARDGARSLPEERRAA